MRSGLIKLGSNLRLIVFVYFVSLLLMACLFAIIENRTIGDGLWWAVVTALTIGYGDVVPVTTLGKIVGGIFQHFWIFCIAPLVVVNLVTKLQHNDFQFSHQKQEWIMDALESLGKQHNIPLPERPHDMDLHLQWHRTPHREAAKHHKHTWKVRYMTAIGVFTVISIVWVPFSL